jgi:hypothetical protein
MALLSKTVNWEQVKTKVLNKYSAIAHPEAEANPWDGYILLLFTGGTQCPDSGLLNCKCAAEDRLCSREQMCAHSFGTKPLHLRWRQDLMYSCYQRGCIGDQRRSYTYFSVPIPHFLL